MPTLPTMTLHDCAEGFRANQIPITEDLLADGIENGKFPFAVGLTGKQRKPIIFRDRFYAWLSDMLLRPAIRAYEDVKKEDHV